MARAWLTTLSFLGGSFLLHTGVFFGITFLPHLSIPQQTIIPILLTPRKEFLSTEKNPTPLNKKEENKFSQKLKPEQETSQTIEPIPLSKTHTLTPKINPSIKKAEKSVPNAIIPSRKEKQKPFFSTQKQETAQLTTPPLQNAPKIHLIYSPSPNYPELARQQALEGTVLLRLLITQTGRVDALFIVRSSGSQLLDNEALRTVKKWIFALEKQLDRRNHVQIDLPVRFKLRKD